MKNIKSACYIRSITMFLMIMLISWSAKATDWYASPTASVSGTGTLANPFTLQAALNTPSIVAGDKLWLRGGIPYVGRFTSSIFGLPGNNITVSSYPGEWAVLNGNIGTTSSSPHVLHITGGYVTFRDFEITYSNPVRNTTSPNFIVCNGLEHYAGEDCKFINLVIHDNPGEGIGSWKFTGGTEFYGCIIYNNGIYTPGGRGHGPGIYTQNSHATKYRKFRNNIVFNNFYHGFEVYSETSPTAFPFVQNYILDDNTSFNNGSPYRYYPAGGSILSNGDTNMAVKSSDTSGNGVLNHIDITNNVMYHNTDYTINGSLNETKALEIGSKSENHPAQHIYVHNNFISGRNNALQFYGLDTVTFTHNRSLGRFVTLMESNALIMSGQNWNFHDNIYYSRYGDRIFKFEIGPGPLVEYDMAGWQTFGIDPYPSRRHMFMLAGNSAADNPPNILQITQNEYKSNQFKVVLFNPPPNSVSDVIPVDFSSFGILPGTPYKIIDIESYPTVAINANLPIGSTTVNFNLNMTSPAFSAPLGIDFPPNYSKLERTPDNFGVFLIEFEHCVPNLVISTNVTSGSDQQQASNTIRAFNTISTSATAIYHAGSEVLLTDGFTAISGSTFRGYIEGCSNNYVARINTQEPHSPRILRQKSAAAAIGQLSVYPNPTTDLLNISLTSGSILSLTLTSIEGKTVLTKDLGKNTSNDMHTLDISTLSKGIYILSVKGIGQMSYTQKIIKN